MTARQVPFNYSFQWILCSYKILEKNFTLFLACSIFTFLTGTAVGLLPYFGPVLAGLLNFIYLLAYLRFGEKVLAGETLTFENFVNMAFDQSILKKFKPYLAAVAIVALVQAVINVARLYSLALPVSLMSFIVIGAGAFAAFSQINDTVMEPVDRIKKVALAFWSNVGALVVYALYMFALGAACTLMCVVPLFIFALPMSVMTHYLIYSSLFLNRDIDATIAEWTTREPIATEGPVIDTTATPVPPPEEPQS